MGDVIVKLSVPGSVRSRGKVLEVVERVCRKLAGDKTLSEDAFVHEMVSAVGEAFNNIALHAYDDENRAQVLLELSCDSAVVTATLKDFGFAFEPSPAKEMNFGEMTQAELPESGMGLYIMRAFVDEIVYEPGTPNILHLRKRIIGETAPVETQ